MKKLALSLCVCLVLAPVVVWAGEEAKPDAKTQEAIVQMAAKAKDVKTFTADFSMTGLPGGQTVAGKISFLVPDKMRMVTTIPMQNMKMEQTTISDGKVTWVLMMGMIVKVDITKVKEALKEAGMPDQGAQHNLASPLAMLDGGTVKFTGAEKVKEDECWVFEGAMKAPPQGAPAVFKTARVYVATADGLGRKVAFIGADGKEAAAFVYEGVKVNPELAADTFTYTPAEGARVMDQTDATIQVLKDMLGKPKPEGEAAPKSKAPETR